MERRVFLKSVTTAAFTRTAALLAGTPLLALTPRAVQADIVDDSPTPPRLDVRAESPTFRGTPSSVALLVRNPSSEPRSLQGVRLLVVDAGLRFPLRITRASLDGVAIGVYDSFVLGPTQTRRLAISFEGLPASALRARELNLLVRIGYAAETTVTLRRS